MVKKLVKYIPFLFIYQVIMLLVFQAQLKRVGAFGCFDDCFNFGAGHFMLQGKNLYSQIFFNHQPFMAYISAVVQYVSHPQTLFELIKYHRIAALLFANLCGTLLILRFGFPLFAALILFEATKFYVFGDRFLAEGIIVYPMMYLTLLVWNKSIGKVVYAREYIVAAICSWFIFWMREPFIPWSVVAICMLFFIAYKDSHQKKNLLQGIIVIIVLHLITIMTLPMNEYIFNVIQANMMHEVSVQLWTVLTIAQIVFYPVFVLMKGWGGLFQNSLFVLSIIFFVGIGYELLWKRRYVAIGIVVLLLAAANMRVVPVGTVYYDAFHMIPWYGMYIAIVTMFVKDMWEKKNIKMIAIGCYVVLGVILVYELISPISFIREKSNTELEFNNNYANYFSKGQVIKVLAKPGDTMFVEMWEDPIYFVAGVDTAYSYSWYTSIMPLFPKYRTARAEMFVRNPPTFYVGACRSGEVDSFPLAQTDKDYYVHLLNSGKPSCVYVRKEKFETFNKEISDKIRIYGYSFP